MKFVEVFPRGTRGLTPFADSNVKFSGMIAVHLEKRRVEVRNVRRPRRTQGFALMRLLCGGICNTDLELQRGYSGFSGTPGHEFSRCGRFEPALSLLQSGQINVIDMISEVMPLAHARRAFARAAERGVLKVLLT